jgi:hypothetical protein
MNKKHKSTILCGFINNSIFIFNFHTGNDRRAHVNSHDRLFGEVERHDGASKNHFKSNIPIGGDEADSTLRHANGNGNGHHEYPSHENGNGVANGKSNGGNLSNF